MGSLKQSWTGGFGQMTDAHLKSINSPWVASARVPLDPVGR